MSPIKTIIFDLDGTLIDSSKSILAGFAAAFNQEGRTPTRLLTPEIIGPPLKETLSMLAGTADPALINRLAEYFKGHYDTEGFKQTTVFEGVPEVLAALHRAGFPLYIATNKRLAPTTKIIAHLGWSAWFTKIFALDAWMPAAAHKADMIDRAIAELKIVRANTLYVGDRREDGEAATVNALRFALAEWGYGLIEDETPPQWTKLSRPVQLLSLAGGN